MVSQYTLSKISTPLNLTRGSNTVAKLCIGHTLSQYSFHLDSICSIIDIKTSLNLYSINFLLISNAYYKNKYEVG